MHCCFTAKIEQPSSTKAPNHVVKNKNPSTHPADFAVEVKAPWREPALLQNVVHRWGKFFTGDSLVGDGLFGKEKFFFNLGHRKIGKNNFHKKNTHPSWSPCSSLGSWGYWGRFLFHSVENPFGICKYFSVIGEPPTETPPIFWQGWSLGGQKKKLGELCWPTEKFWIKLARSNKITQKISWLCNNITPPPTAHQSTSQPKRSDRFPCDPVNLFSKYIRLVKLFKIRKNCFTHSEHIWS